MITLRKASDRGRSNISWLNSYHTFSFSHYHDPAHMGFGPLRVINDDRVVAGAGFGEHGHSDMEIISYVIEGGLAHRDSMGNGSTIRPGQVQRMSAGTGVTHSEFNGSKTEPVHFLQIWILPERRGMKPSYEEKTFPDQKETGLIRLADRQGSEGAVTVHQDMVLYRAFLDGKTPLNYTIAPNRKMWLHVISGPIKVAGHTLNEGDGAAITDEKALNFDASSRGQALLFDLAA